MPRERIGSFPHLYAPYRYPPSSAPMMLKFRKPRNIGLRFGVTQLPGVAGAQLVPAAVLVLAGAPPSVAAAGVYPSYMPPRQPIFLFLHQPRSWMPVSRL